MPNLQKDSLVIATGFAVGDAARKVIIPDTFNSTISADSFSITGMVSVAQGYAPVKISGERGKEGGVVVTMGDKGNSFSVNRPTQIEGIGLKNAFRRPEAMAKECGCGEIVAREPGERVAGAVR